MRRLSGIAALLWLFASVPTWAGDFSGYYSVSLCTDGPGKPCGLASLSLIQTGSKICGDHFFITAGGGRMNEGFPGSVVGVVVGSTAVLTITSGRNNGIVLGKAVLRGQNIYWQTLEQVSKGAPEGDELIFGKGLLTRNSKAESERELISMCTH